MCAGVWWGLASLVVLLSGCSKEREGTCDEAVRKRWTLHEIDPAEHKDDFTSEMDRCAAKLADGTYTKMMLGCMVGAATRDAYAVCEKGSRKVTDLSCEAVTKHAVILAHQSETLSADDKAKISAAGDQGRANAVRRCEAEKPPVELMRCFMAAATYDEYMSCPEKLGLKK